MAIRILSESHVTTPVDSQSLIAIIERARDRVRTASDMVLNLSGILLTASVAISVFTLEHQPLLKTSVYTLVSAATLFLLSACLSIWSSFIKTAYSITTEEQVINDLLVLMRSELALLRASFAVLVFGALVLLSGVLMSAVRR